ncbi:MAG: hypothetical protein QXI07_01930 [Pyrobaculum sp.]
MTSVLIVSFILLSVLASYLYLSINDAELLANGARSVLVYELKSGGTSPYSPITEGYRFYLRLYIDGEWCHLWANRVRILDNGTHTTLWLSDGRARCGLGVYIGREEGGYVYFSSYNITRAGTIRKEPIVIAEDVNAVVISRDPSFEIPNVTVYNKTAWFIVVERGVMKYNTVFVERVVHGVNQTIADKMRSEAMRLVESVGPKTGLVVAPVNVTYKNGELHIKPAVELRFLQQVVRREVEVGNTTYFMWYWNEYLLAPSMDIYASATYRYSEGFYTLQEIVIRRESLTFLPYPIVEMFGITPWSFAEGDIIIMLKT